MSGAYRSTARERGTVGDVNPIDHGGGFILFAPGQSPWIEFTHGISDDDREIPDEWIEDGEPNQAFLAQQVTVYRVDLETCGEALLSSLDWCDLSEVERSCGYAGTDNPYGNLRALRQRARLVEDVAGYYGWHELDDDPLVMTLGELRERWAKYL